MAEEEQVQLSGHGEDVSSGIAGDRGVVSPDPPAGRTSRRLGRWLHLASIRSRLLFSFTLVVLLSAAVIITGSVLSSLNSGGQLTGMEQIALAMNNIHQVTAQSVAGAQQSERAAEELSNLAHQLHQVVEQYQL